MIKVKNHKYLRENQPYALLRLGLSCNANCLFCNVPSESYSMKEMSTKVAKREIINLISLNKEIRLDITGGEPTIRRDLPMLIKFASQNGASVIQIQTNGIALSDKGYLKRLKQNGLNKVFVALHSNIAKNHDKLVCFKGAFMRCIQGIKNSIELGIEVILNPVITAYNYVELPDYITFIKNELPQIKYISLSVVQPRGRAWANKKLIPRYRTIDPYVEEALRLGEKYGLTINNPYCGLPLCIGGWYRYLNCCVEYCENILKMEGGAKRNSCSEKVKSSHCLKCDLYDFCNGVWREYSRLYPFYDLKPIIMRNGQFSLYSNNTKV